jgi:hypothetical protein
VLLLHTRYLYGCYRDNQQAQGQQVAFLCGYNLLTAGLAERATGALQNFLEAATFPYLFYAEPVMVWHAIPGECQLVFPLHGFGMEHIKYNDTAYITGLYYREYAETELHDDGQNEQPCILHNAFLKL